MTSHNTYYWLNPTRLPVLESVGLILILFWMVCAFKFGSLALIFQYEDHALIPLHETAITIQTPEESELFFP